MLTPIGVELRCNARRGGSSLARDRPGRALPVRPGDVVVVRVVLEPETERSAGEVERDGRVFFVGGYACVEVRVSTLPDEVADCSRGRGDDIAVRVDDRPTVDARLG